LENLLLWRNCNLMRNFNLFIRGNVPFALKTLGFERNLAGAILALRVGQKPLPVGYDVARKEKNKGGKAPKYSKSAMRCTFPFVVYRFRPNLAWLR
jgi:hypothetical protein